MPRSSILLAAIFGIALISYDYSYFIYGRGKLESLGPRILAAQADWAGEAEGARLLLLVGDSRVAQWPLRPQPGWRLGRIGFSGETAANIEPALRAPLAEARPYAVVIQAGTNDAIAAVFQTGAAREETLARAVRAVMAMAQRAREAGARRVIVLTVAPPIEPELWKRALMGTMQESLIEALNPPIRREAAARGYEILDAAALFRGPDGGLRRDYRRDGLHWSPAAYEMLNAAVFAQLEKEPEPSRSGP